MYPNTDCAKYLSALIPVIFLATFTLAIYIYRHNHATMRFLLFPTSAMFLLATAQIALKLTGAAIILRAVKQAVLGGSVAPSTSVYERLMFVRYLILNTNKSVDTPIF